MNLVPESYSLSSEQLEVIQSTGDLKVPSFAGSGKSTTLANYISQRPKERILYQCFNRSTRFDFEKKVKEQNLTHVTVTTAHSLAKRSLYGFNTVNLTGYLDYNLLKEVLHSDLSVIPRDFQILALKHTERYINHFCHSLAKKFNDFNYLGFVPPEHESFVSRYHSQISGMARLVMTLMHNHKIPVLHDFYLKLYYLAPKKLPYDTILFDEFQDCSPVMALLHQSQNARKIYVGDPHQLIYGFRGAIDTFNLLNVPSSYLSESFRFGNNIASFANTILDWKNSLYNISSTTKKILGRGPDSNPNRKHLTIARSNICLLSEALQVTQKHPKLTYNFIGGFYSYIRHESGFTIYDLINLSGEKYALIKNPFLASFDSYNSLIEYLEISQDHSITSMVKLIGTYGKSLEFLIRKLERNCKPETEITERTFSTAHKSKGLQSREVNLLDDFMTYKDLLAQKRLGKLDKQQILEEINLLYVAITRATHVVDLPAKYVNTPV